MTVEADPPKRDLAQRTFEFATRVVKLCAVLNEKPGVGRTLATQLLRAATSVGANIEEGQGSQSRADFIAKYSISCKEARESHYWLRLLAAAQVLPETKLLPLIDEANQLVAILTTIVKKCRQNKTAEVRKMNGEE